MALQEVDYNIAKLAWSLGFKDHNGKAAFTLDGKQRISTSSSFYNSEQYPIKNCTYSLLQQWLREEEEIDIVVSPFISRSEDGRKIYMQTVYCDREGVEHTDPDETEYETYEEALDVSLLEALNLLADLRDKASKELKSSDILEVIDKLPHSKSRVPYSYHHDYLRDKVAKYSSISRSEIASLDIKDSDSELYAVALIAILDELGSDSLLHITSTKDIAICKKAKELTKQVICKHQS